MDTHALSGGCEETNLVHAGSFCSPDGEEGSAAVRPRDSSSSGMPLSSSGRMTPSQGVGTGSNPVGGRSEEHTSELQSLMRISYAVFCLKKKKRTDENNYEPLHKNRNKYDDTTAR